MQRVKAAWPCIASAALLLLAYHPFNFTLLIFVALAPWLASLKECSSKGAWKRGYLFGIVYGLGQFYWLGTLTAKWTESPLLGLVPLMLASALLAIYYGLFAMLCRICWQRNWLILIPVLWSGMEAFRSYIPVLAFPYGLIATPLWPYLPVVQTAAVGTIYLVSGWVLLMNVMCAGWLSGTGYAPLRPLFTAFLGCLGVSMALYSVEQTITKKAITIGQPGVDLAFTKPEIAQLKLQTNIEGILERASRSKSDLTVLPEGVSRLGSSMPPHPEFAIPKNLPVIFGAQRGQNPSYQSAFGYDGKWSYIDKTRLVIFGEFVPARDFLPFLKDAFKLPGGDLSAGDKVSALEVNGIRVGPVICFEALFPDISYRQAMNHVQMLSVMSIDDWYMGTGAPDQLRAGSVWRAIETGLPVVRAASTGSSLAIDGKGRVLAEAPMGVPFVLSVDVPVPTNPMPHWWLPIYPLLSVCALVAVPWWSKRTQSKK